MQRTNGNQNVINQTLTAVNAASVTAVFGRCQEFEIRQIPRPHSPHPLCLADHRDAPVKPAGLNPTAAKPAAAPKPMADAWRKSRGAMQTGSRSGGIMPSVGSSVGSASLPPLAWAAMVLSYPAGITATHN